jgi:hypothetical protein
VAAHQALQISNQPTARGLDRVGSLAGAAATGAVTGARMEMLAGLITRATQLYTCCRLSSS